MLRRSKQLGEGVRNEVRMGVDCAQSLEREKECGEHVELWKRYVRADDFFSFIELCKIWFGFVNFEKN